MEEEGTGFPAIRWGLVFGIILVVIGVIPLIWVVAHGYHVPPDSAESRAIVNQLGVTLLYYVIGSVVISLLSYFLAGFMTARDTGTVPAGAFAAAVAYLAFSMVSYVVSAVVLKLSAGSLLNDIAGLSGSTRAALAFSYALSSVCGLLIGALLSAGIGALGALLGRAIYGSATYK